jgi:hypothetical protein
MAHADEFFPSLAYIADKTSGQSTVLDQEAKSSAETEDAPLEEIESLCMQCGEQVRRYSISLVAHSNLAYRARLECF